MRLCQHCGAGIPNYSGFCGMCGQLVSIGEPTTGDRTAWMSYATHSNKEPKTLITEPGDRSEQTGLDIEDEETGENTVVIIEDEGASENTLVTAEDEEEEERRRSILADFSLPLLVDSIAGQPTQNVPGVQGTPQIVGAPTIQGTPHLGGGSSGEAGPGYALVEAGYPLVLPQTQIVIPPPPVTSSPPYFTPRTDGLPHLPHKPKQPQPTGCMVWLAVIIIVPLLILVSIIGVGLTILAPTLSLNGNASVAIGKTLQLNGNHFIPGNAVSFLLDGSVPLFYSSIMSPTERANAMTGALVLANQDVGVGQMAQESGSTANKTVYVASDGTFIVTFVVGADWKMGQHMIRASEQLSPRSATATFIITGNAQPTGPATSVATTTTTKTPTVTPTSTPTHQVTKGLSAITPNVVAFGPLSEGYTQPTSTSVLLSTTGTGILNWTANWNTAQAPWLNLNMQAGQVQEPNAQTLVLSAKVGNLKAGTYNATVTFSTSGQNPSHLLLSVSLVVQAGCIKATPATLTFNGTIGANDPAAQTLAVNNCGALGSWTETTTGGAWLLASPTGGNLNNGATQNMIVSAMLANVTGVGTYHGQITLNNGATHALVKVIFIVKAAPLPVLSINPTTVSINHQCTFVRTIWKCSVTLSSSATAQSNLNWIAISTGIVAIPVTSTSGVLQPGQTAAIEIDTPRVACDGTTPLGTVIFTGPANPVTVKVTC